MRKLTDGKTVVVTTVGQNRDERGTAAVAAERAGVAAESALQFFYEGRVARYTLLAAPAIVGLAILWRRRRKARRA